MLYSENAGIIQIQHSCAPKCEKAPNEREITTKTKRSPTSSTAARNSPELKPTPKAAAPVLQGDTHVDRKRPEPRLIRNRGQEYFTWCHEGRPSAAAATNDEELQQREHERARQLRTCTEQKTSTSK